MGRQTVAKVIDLRAWARARRERALEIAFSNGAGLNMETWELKRVHDLRGLRAECVRQLDPGFYRRASRIATMFVSLTRCQLVDFEPSFWEMMSTLVETRKLREYAGGAVLRSTPATQLAAYHYFLETDRCRVTGLHADDLRRILDPLEVRLVRYEPQRTLDMINRYQAAQVTRDFVLDVLAHLYITYIGPGRKVA